MLAAELARKGVASTLIEGRGRPAKGTAYSTDEDAHLLNVPAGRMGAWADQPGHFAKEVEREGFEPHDFVPRRRYGEYLRKILNEAEASGRVSVAQPREWLERRWKQIEESDRVGEDSELSFPASDAPAWTATTGTGTPGR